MAVLPGRPGRQNSAYRSGCQSTPYGAKLSALSVECELLKYARYSYRMTENFITLTEESNALDYLEKAVGFIQTAPHAGINWKWVILSLHAALYGFMICTLKGTNPDNVCTISKAGHKKLINFTEALKRCQQSEWMSISGFTNVLTLTDEDKLALKIIHDDFRNQFLHYRPTMWSIEVTGMPFVITLVLDVLRRVVLQMGGFYAHYDRKQVADLIANAQELLHTM